MPESLVRVAKARRHGDGACLPLRADLVAAAIERRHHLAHKLARFLDHLGEQGGVGVFGHGRQFGQVLVRAQHVEQHEGVVGGVGVVGIHTVVVFRALPR
ncbi:hypothetical protein D9M69_669200 [compost metagenome]